MEHQKCSKSSMKKPAVQKLLDVEAALALAHAEVGNIPKKDAEKIAAMASTKYVKVERVKAIEKEIKHDIASLVRALSEVCGASGAYVHLGATSYDIVDTANALQLKDALDVIEKRLVRFQGYFAKTSAPAQRHSYDWQNPRTTCFAHYFGLQVCSLGIRS